MSSDSGHEETVGRRLVVVEDRQQQPAGRVERMVMRMESPLYMVVGIVGADAVVVVGLGRLVVVECRQVVGCEDHNEHEVVHPEIRMAGDLEST